MWAENFFPDTYKLCFTDAFLLAKSINSGGGPGIKYPVFTLSYPSALSK